MLLERENELMTLSVLSKRLLQNRGSVALVNGEAGIGKTSLLRQFRSQLGDEYDCRWGGCDPLDTPRVLGPFHDMAGLFTDNVQEALASGEAFSQILTPLLNEFKSVKRPVVLIIEDVHWADNTSLDVIKCLGRRITFLNLLMILSYRSEETNSSDGLKQVLGEFHSTDTHRINVRAISPAGVDKLAGKSGGRPDGLYEMTQGNPFYVTEMLSAGEASITDTPASIKDAVGARLNRLSKDVQQFLETIALIPYAVNPEMLSTLFTDEIVDLVDISVDKKFLYYESNGTLRFRHEIARLGTADRVSRTRRKMLHQKVVDYLLQEKIIKHDLLVFHALAAENALVVLEHAPLAAAAASLSGSHAEAAMHLGSALQFAGLAGAEDCARLHEQWSYESGLVKVDTKTIEAREIALQKWQEIGRADKIGENLRWLSRLHWYRGESDKADNYLDQALKVLEGEELSAERGMAYSQRSQYHMLNDRMHEAIEWGLKALEVEKQFPNTEVRVHAFNNIGTAYLFIDNSAGLEYMQSSLELALSHKLHEHAARAYTNLSDYAVNCRQFELASQTITDGIVFDTSHDLDSWTHYLTGYHAQLKMEQGMLLEAESIAQGVLDIQGQTLLMRLPALLVLSRTRLRLGRHDAQELAQKALKDALSTHETQYILPARLTLVEAAWLAGDNDIAQQQLDNIVQMKTLPGGLWRSGEYAIWLARFGIDYSGSHDGKLALPYEMEIQGDIPGAADQWLEHDCPLQAAITLMQGDAAILPQNLGRAVDLLNDIGAYGFSGKIESLKSNLSCQSSFPKVKRGPQKNSRKHPLGLTKKEQELVPLIVSGLSNKEISDQLVRSIRTVENHVASILKKFDVSNRMELMLRVNGERWLIGDKNSANEADTVRETRAAM